MSTAPLHNEQGSAERRWLALGNFRLFARLGTGGMADVYLAVAQGAMNVNRLVVVKRLRDDQASDPSVREMFLNEARVAARLNHPNVLQTFEAGVENGSYYIAMEYVDGQPFSRILTKLKREGKVLDPKIAARICSHALEGLHYAHELVDFDGTPLQIVHRDVSPQNIMLTYDGRVKLVDFGIAKVVGTTQTAHGVFKGKVAFMAPEQVLGGQIDRRADLFAMGICLWESVTGKHLIAEDTPAKTLYNLVNKELPRASEVNPNVPLALCAVIMKSLERDPANRYQSAKEMRDALEIFVGREGGATYEEVGEIPQKLFADTRDKVKAQIKAQVAALSLARTSEPSIPPDDIRNTHIRSTGSALLIDLSDAVGPHDTSGSNASLFRVVTSVGRGSLPAPAPPPSKVKKLAFGVWVAVTLAALGVSALALARSQRNAQVAAPPAVTTPVTTTATAPPSTSEPASALSISAQAAPSTSATNTPNAPDAKAPMNANANAWNSRPPPAVLPRTAPPATAPTPPAHTTTAEPARTSSAQPTSKPAETQQGRTFRREL